MAKGRRGGSRWRDGGAGAREAAVRAARWLAGEGSGAGRRWRRSRSEARRRRAVATCYPGAAEEDRGPGAHDGRGSHRGRRHVLLYLRNGRNADDRAGWSDCCSFAQARRRAAAAGRAARIWVHGRRGMRRQGVCVCALRWFWGGGRVGGGLRRDPPKALACRVGQYSYGVVLSFLSSWISMPRG